MENRLKNGVSVFSLTFLSQSNIPAGTRSAAMQTTKQKRYNWYYGSRRRSAAGNQQWRCLFLLIRFCARFWKYLTTSSNLINWISRVEHVSLAAASPPSRTSQRRLKLMQNKYHNLIEYAPKMLSRFSCFGRQVAVAINIKTDISWFLIFVIRSDVCE